MKQIGYFTLLVVALLGTASLQAEELAPTDSLLQQESPAPQPQSEAPLTLDQCWDEANTAYLRSDYRTAIRIYQQILEQEVASAKLYYNLGNAYFKDEQLGEAILYYHRALRLKPGDEDIRYNLSVAENRTIDRIEEIPEFFLKGWLREVRTLLSGTTWTLLSLLLLAATLGCVLFYLLSQRLSLRKAGFFGTLACGLLFLAATAFAASDRSERIHRTEAVLLSPAVSAKASPDKSATDLFLLHEGTTLTLGDVVGEWQEITLSDGKKGWLERRHIEAI